MNSRERKEIERYIDMAVKKSIDAYKKSGLLKDSSSTAYAEVSVILTRYYEDGMKDAAVRSAIDCLVDDLYFSVIPMYYQERMTIEGIADQFGVDISTIVRNKKRLCMEIYASLE